MIPTIPGVIFRLFLFCQIQNKKAATSWLQDSQAIQSSQGTLNKSFFSWQILSELINAAL